jgi:membrane protein YdbS with pleckstrin-like domain
VSDTGGPGPQKARFTLTAPPPVRSLAISAVVALIAAAMIVLGSALDLPRAVTIAGVILMIFACALAVVALVLTARLRMTLALDPQSITIIKGRRRRVVPWSTIDVVKRQGPRLLLITKPGDSEDVTVVNPPAATDATFDALIAEIQRRLDADRGYRPIP